MPQTTRLNPRTASLDQSIWRDISEDDFRNHLVALEERTNAVVVQPQVFPLTDLPVSLAEKERLLPIEIEQKLADDFAYIAAVGEGAQSVSAVCIEEHRSSSKLTVRFAAVDAIGEQLQDAFANIGSLLKSSASLTTCTNSATDEETLLKLIIKQHFPKLLGRLRSTKWQKPKYLARTHKKPLCHDFDNLIHRVQFVYPKKKNPTRPAVEAQTKDLANIYLNFENVQAGAETEFEYMVKIVKGSYSFCKFPQIQDFADKLERGSSPTPQVAAALKSMRQIEKIGAYRRIAYDLVQTAKQYPSLFTCLEFSYMSPYDGIVTTVGYEDWAKTLHVHAEVQLVVYYDTLKSLVDSSMTSSNDGFYRPRVIGTSKYLCYLCFLFLREHEGFVVCNTHGRLYDQWTIPDLSEFSDTRKMKYREIIQNMDTTVQAMSTELGPLEGKRDAWRVEPMTSRQNLLSLCIGAVDGETAQNRDLYAQDTAALVDGVRALHVKDLNSAG